MTIYRTKTHVRGLDEALKGGIPDGHVVLVSGAPGTMKSSFCFSILYQNALKGLRSAYLTIEQAKGTLLEHMRSLGMTDEAAYANISIHDFGKVRREPELPPGARTWTELLKMDTSSLRKDERISMLVIDSLDVLEGVAKFQDRRTDLYHLFEWLRDLGTTTLVITETLVQAAPGGTFRDETFLADGIFEMSLERTSDVFVQRRIRCVKMRSTNHDTGYYSLAFEDGRFEVTRAVSGAG